MMASPRAVTVDTKGRVHVLGDLREELDIRAGDVLFVESDASRTVLRFAKAANPFNVLAEHVEGEYRAGRTKRLRAFAAENDIQPTGE